MAENSAGFTVLSGVELALAKALRMASSAPVYVAGLERREPLMGVWSMKSMRFATSSGRHASSEDLPEPATPVMALSTLIGMSTSMPRRLLRRASRVSIVPVAARTSSLSCARTARWRPTPSCVSAGCLCPWRGRRTASAQ
ncbi:TPA: hypothetical protein JAL37_001631 [Corynebacterium striatum]|nr:hypothetical protein [Corynebacterium striatum]